MSDQPTLEDLQEALMRVSQAGTQQQTQLNPWSPDTDNPFGRTWFQMGGDSDAVYQERARQNVISELRNRGYTGDTSLIQGKSPQELAISGSLALLGQQDMEMARSKKRNQDLSSLQPLLQLKNQQIDRQNQWDLAGGAQQLAGLRYQTDSNRVLGKYQIDSQKQMAMLNSRDQILDRAGQLTANLVQANRLR